MGKDKTKEESIIQINHFYFHSPAHANKLVHQEKIKTIEELRSHPKRDQLLNKTQQLGLKYLEEFEQKIPRDEMKQMEVKHRFFIHSIYFFFSSFSDNSST